MVLDTAWPAVNTATEDFADSFVPTDKIPTYPASSIRETEHAYPGTSPEQDILCPNKPPTALSQEVLKIAPKMYFFLDGTDNI